MASPASTQIPVDKDGPIGAAATLSSSSSTNSGATSTSSHSHAQVIPDLVACDKGTRSTRNSVEDVWGPRAPYYGAGEWPVRWDMSLEGEGEPDAWIQSACLLCSNGCGLDIGVRDGKMVGVRGRPNDRVSRGRLGPKGLHCHQVNHHKQRLTTPLVRKDGELKECSWEEAMTLLVNRSKDVIRRRTAHAMAFYTSGQLMLEEYHALAMIGKAGLHSLHMDGNTRLCTATSAAAMRESFGTDGQVGSYEDIDLASCIFLCGHNMSNTQTVLWCRILDRLAGPNPPKLIVMDPRVTDTAKHATIHLALKSGTNLAILNGLAHLIIKHKLYNKEYVEKSTILFDELERVSLEYPPEKVAAITGVSAEKIIDAAKLLAEAPRLVSTVLQGVYQSNQATASACAVNNLHLLLGQIGKPGCAVLQFNGQPTAQNNREAGCNGEFPGFRNYQNPQHMASLAEAWNVDAGRLPVWHVPTHIMSLMHHIKQGTIEFMWVSGTNPAVSLPTLENARELFSKPDLFLVVQDIFFNETAALADLVLPAAMWGEKTGTFTNVDRTVHLSNKAVNPPGFARSDLEIFVEYSRRMGMLDKDGQPLLPFNTPEEAFDHFKRGTKGRLCDYSGISYEKLRTTMSGGIQWPCNEEHPDGTARLYTDGVFLTGINECESYGHDLDTGAPLTREQYLALKPNGRALFKVAHYRPSAEQPNAEYPFQLMTGRNVFHFHTRTKTGRMEHLQSKEPEPWLEINEEDATKHGIREGDLVEVSSTHGSVAVPARIGKLAPGHLFIPFHYGYFDRNNADPKTGRHKSRLCPTAANELTTKLWDPVSKQPILKMAAVKIRKAEPAGPQVKIHEKQSATENKVVQSKHTAKDHVFEPDWNQQQHLAHLLARCLRFSDLLLDAEEKMYTKAMGQGREEMASELHFLMDLTSMVSQKLSGQRARFPLVPRDQFVAHRKRLMEIAQREGTTGATSSEPQALGVEVEAASGGGGGGSGAAVKAGGMHADRMGGLNIMGCTLGWGIDDDAAASTMSVVAMFQTLFPPSQPGPVSYVTLLELQSLFGWTSLMQAQLQSLRVAGLAMADDPLTHAIVDASEQTERQTMWALAKIKAFGAQTLLVPV